MDYKISKSDMLELLAKASEIGFQRGKEHVNDKYISKNKAFRIFGRGRIEEWISEGSIKIRTSGRGNTAKRYLEYAKLLELDASEKLTIHYN
ncbi:MAG: hypothetical protein LBE91_18990 [Tannerella sp.]|jgi:hypothetical protein|nr:hypothetical protein [Tannerella sp.]